jgi:hypothetical protein
MKGAREAETLRRVAEEYRARGYTVHIEPQDELLPPFLSGLRPDLVAQKPGDNVVVEVKHGHGRAYGERLRPIAERVAAQPGWRFTLVVEPERGEPNLAAGFAPPIGLEEIRDRLRRARELARGSQHDAAFLLAWTSLEAALRRIAERAVLPIGTFSLSALIRELQSSGEIDASQYERAMEALGTRNALVHGLAGTVGEDRVRALDALARELVEDLSTAA